MILVTGATGFLGKRICRLLKNSNKEFVTTSLSLGIDLRDYNQTVSLFKSKNITKVINCAAFVGGIQFGIKRPAEIFHNNMLMTLNLFKVCKDFNIKRIINPISNCAYPAKLSYFRESEFWDGSLHETVMVYGMCRKMSWVGSYAYQKEYGLGSINLILSNMYGPDDHFDEERSHALGAIIMKTAKAKIKNEPFVEIWGTGKPIREWLYVDDGAAALIKALDLEKYEDIINIGVGSGISIHDLSLKIKKLIGYSGQLKFDKTKEDGAFCKTVDGSIGQKILDWKPGVNLNQGLTKTINWYLENII